ncbi:MAG: hypothetical protein J4472_00665 [DPANN group archaeon]|nr:hypothetical protein [DPANN group archaeon]
MRKALKDTPLREITLRKYEEPSNLSRRELTKKFLLSIGLLQPGESRDVIVDIFHALLLARKNKEHLNIQQFCEKLSTKPGASKPNIRRQLRRLKELKLIEKTSEGYRVTEFGSLQPIIDEFVLHYIVNPAIERVKQYAEHLDKLEDN